MLAHGFLGIFLHARVDGGIDFQTVGVDVVFGPVGLAGLLRPSEKRIRGPGYRIVGVALRIPRRIVGTTRTPGGEEATQFFAEIWCQTVFVVHTLEIESQRQGAQAVELGTAEAVVLVHLLQHGIAPQTGALGMAHRIEIAWILHHAYQSRGLECVQFGGLTVEIHLGGTFDAHGII